MQELADHGFAGFGLEGIAERAGVTRNLLYHYFPRGKLGAFVAAVQHASDQVTAGWSTERAQPIEDRWTANVHRFVAHAAEPSLAWRCLRQARLSPEPEAVAVLRHLHGAVVANMSLNNFGTTEPSPVQSAALHAYIAFAEELLERWRDGGFDFELAVVVLRRTLHGVVDGARAAVIDDL